MSNLDYFIIYLTSVFSTYVTILSFNKLINKKVEYNLKNIIIVLFAGIIITINIYVSQGMIKILISYLTLYLTSFALNKENSIKTIFYMIICYLMLLFYEIILSIVVMQVSDIDTFNSSIVIKTVYSVINVLLVYFTCCIKKIRKIINNMCNKFNSKSLILIFILFFASLVVIDYKYIINFSINVYISNLILLLSVIILVIMTIYNYINVIKKTEKEEALLNFMSKYEKIIDEDRINRHEMLNNLLFLKSFDDKNSSEYEQSLDELIKTYNKKGIGVKNIYKLPNGLKGIFYYKLSGLETEGFKLNINISNKLSNSFKKLPHNEYIILYKIVGILLDNAVEAAEKSKDKYIGIDIYNEKSNIVIIIDNSFKGKIYLNKINNKDYTSKGKNRGLGLFIVNKLLKESELIHLEQIIELNVFTSKIIIKKDK